MMCKIAIVGGGLSGLSTLRALIGAAPGVRRGDFSVTVFDSQPLGRGSAFAADQDSYLFNTLPIKTWGTCVQNPLEYYRWLKEYQPGSQDTYVPRSYYRRYLLQCLENIKSVARAKSITLETVYEEVTFARKEGDSMVLGTPQTATVSRSGPWRRSR